MNKAGAKSIPYYRKLKTLKTTGKGIWNKKISLAAKEAKSAHRKWKDKKNIHLNADLDKQELKNKKRNLRQLQRQAHASKKEQCIGEIMEAS
jgi:predicted ribosome quality control (RQC) complex YloA/Tae2 family protein